MLRNRKRKHPVLYDWSGDTWHQAKSGNWVRHHKYPNGANSVPDRPVDLTPLPDPYHDPFDTDDIDDIEEE